MCARCLRGTTASDTKRPAAWALPPARSTQCTAVQPAPPCSSLSTQPPPLESPSNMLKHPPNLRSLPRPRTALAQVRQWPPDPPNRPPRPPKPPGIIGEPTAPEPWWWTFDYPPPDVGDGGNGFSPPADIVGKSLHLLHAVVHGHPAAGLPCALNKGAGNAGAWLGQHAAASPHADSLHSGLDNIDGELTT